MAAEIGKPFGDCLSDHPTENGTGLGVVATVGSVGAFRSSSVGGRFLQGVDGRLSRQKHPAQVAGLLNEMAHQS